ncbi:TonB-dependent receptor domain-containing protein [Ferruginibacter yonginensis]|uniref:TonB-dependent receptor domain-containing protein n=1 Tax=Ferruginibacter yonginensis TaxID=1310416 RepID=A0ABV8QQP3_9BACT
MKKIYTLICMLVLFTTAHAQKITGNIIDEQNKPIAAATITLLKADAVTNVKFATSLKDGSFTINSIVAGNYVVKITNVGNVTIDRKVVVEDGKTTTLGNIVLTKQTTDLNAVTVVSKKPIVEVKADKTILNVEGTINATGNDALELLRKSPGVMVDKDDNLSLAGKNGVQVYIDGKPSPLSGTDLSNYLKSVQSSQIESIELITNPSAKYEAAGNAGIINIKFKKNKNLGTNGSVNAGYNIGIFSKYNVGSALNYRNAKVNIFGNYNFNIGLNQSSFVSERQQADTFFYQTNKLKSYNDGAHNFKAGLDYFLTKNSTVGVLINGNIADGTTNTDGPMQIIYKPTNTIDRVLYATGENRNKRENVNFNLNYRYALPTGKELNIDADYGFFNLKGNQFQPNNYFNAVNNALLYSNVYRTVSPTNIDIFSVKADYEQPFKKGKLGFGGKIGYVKTDNDFSRFTVFGNTDVFDKDRSNQFIYKENINAVYVNYNRAFKGWVLQAGLRGENTVSKGRSLGLRYNNTTAVYDNYDSTVSRNYFNVFPSAAVTFNKNPKSQFGLSFSRRIDRPAYQDLNPFEFKINDYTFMKGNTQLRPQYTSNVGLTHTYQYKLTTQLTYSHVKDIFTQLPDTTEKSKSFMSKKNLATQNIISLNISYPFSKGWYSLFTNVNSYYSKYEANFGGGDRNVNLDVFAYNIFIQNTFRLGKGITAELSGFYNSPSIWQGIFKSKAMYSIDAGLQKPIFKGKGNLKTSFTDIFKLMRWSGSSNFSGQVSTASGRWESRQFRINFTYRFGNNQVKAARQRKDAVEEERKRTQAAGGFGGQ